MKKGWHKSKVIAGHGLAKTLGYPTINLDNPEILKGRKKGVYLCRIIIKEKLYYGLLYFGPRLILKEEKNIIEVYIIDFHEEIYAQMIEFKLVKYIRGVMDFAKMEDLKEQIEKDFLEAANLIK